MVFEYKFDIRSLLQYGTTIAQSNQPNHRLTTSPHMHQTVQLSVQPPCWLISTEAISYNPLVF